MAKTIIGKIKDSIVIFAGAGCSVAPPASLPGWNDLNDAILETLWDRLGQYDLKARFREKILSSIRQKRKENMFPPDYQAQRMVERAGEKYFQVLSAVDSDTYNAVQYYTALLANAGSVKAVVTTNFDRNFERAFGEAGIPCESFFDEEGFDRLATNDPSAIPIIKIHGCCSSPDSMIDTRKHRLKGRAKALQSALLLLLENHHFIFAGFSGQDLDDNRNYLGLWDAARSAIGFTFLYQPGNSVRESIKNLIEHYGEKKARSVECDSAEYLELLLKSSGITFNPFTADERSNLPIEDRLKEKIASVEPMDAVNMLTGLAESYGDEISARYLYDKVWRERFISDYEDKETLSRFLLNHGRSYVFNFQDKKERARNAGIDIDFIPIGGEAPPGREEIFTNPAKMNLKHAMNKSPETYALIGLAQTYMANPILFSDYPQNVARYFRSQPTKTESADIIYYYSFYALTHPETELDRYLVALKYLNFAVAEMEEDFDEPRLSQLLSRRAMMKLRIRSVGPVTAGEYSQALSTFIEGAKEDALRARALAEKYHEPHLLALSALSMTVLARNLNDFESAFRYIKEAEEQYSELKRIPQYIETIVEYLKVILLGFEKVASDKELLLRIVSEIMKNVELYVVERINVFEPEYCYLMGMILGQYTDASRVDVLTWFADSIFLAEQFNQKANLNYYIETCRQFGILLEVEEIISEAKNRGKDR